MLEFAQSNKRMVASQQPQKLPAIKKAYRIFAVIWEVGDLNTYRYRGTIKSSFQIICQSLDFSCTDIEHSKKRGLNGF